jgi:hypothetical protein
MVSNRANALGVCSHYQIVLLFGFIEDDVQSNDKAFETL